MVMLCGKSCFFVTHFQPIPLVETIFPMIDKFLQDNDISRIKYTYTRICTEGARAVSGKYTGPQGLIKKVAPEVCPPELLCPPDEILNVVLKSVNVIKEQPLKDHHFWLVYTFQFKLPVGTAKTDLNLGNFMDIQDRHITNCKCRDSGMTVEVSGVHFLRIREASNRGCHPLPALTGETGSQLLPPFLPGDINIRLRCTLICGQCNGQSCLNASSTPYGFNEGSKYAPNILESFYSDTFVNENDDNESDIEQPEEEEEEEEEEDEQEENLNKNINH
ncbi:hypothetical protein J6590_094240 [Homalodisca vitripennis]|nr:hypothetical protein J6590_094240 [Homalodisca vitripennis]